MAFGGSGWQMVPLFRDPLLKAAQDNTGTCRQLGLLRLLTPRHAAVFSSFQSGSKGACVPRAYLSGTFHLQTQPHQKETHIGSTWWLRGKGKIPSEHCSRNQDHRIGRTGRLGPFEPNRNQCKYVESILARRLPPTHFSTSV